jgi:hypothetical protein
MKDARIGRVSTRRPVVLIALAGGAGVFLQYFADPRSGRRRRHVAHDRLVATLRRTIWRSGRYLRYLSGQFRGVARPVRHRKSPDNPNPDDNTLRDRVASTLLSPVDGPVISVSGHEFELSVTEAHPREGARASAEPALIDDRLRVGSRKQICKRI